MHDEININNKGHDWKIIEKPHHLINSHQCKRCGLYGSLKQDGTWIRKYFYGFLNEAGRDLAQMTCNERILRSIML